MILTIRSVELATARQDHVDIKIGLANDTMTLRMKADEAAERGLTAGRKVEVDIKVVEPDV